MSLIAEISTASFENEVVKADIPVLIDFHATWCGPCKALMPTLNDVAKEYEGEARIVKVDIDAEPEIAKNFNVRGVPTLVLMNKGEPVERYTGGLTRSKLAAMFDRYVGAAQ